MALSSLTKTAQSFDAWRRGHRKRAPLPPRLKRRAAALIGRHSDHEIITALRTSSKLLRQWHAAYGKAAPAAARRRSSTHCPARRRRRPEKPTFVDITAAIGSGAPGSATLTIELGSGGTIKLTGQLGEAAVRAAVTAAITATAEDRP